MTAEQADVLLEVIEEQNEATGQGYATKAEIALLKAELLAVFSSFTVGQHIVPVHRR